jgi:hypothetical protein
MPLKNQWLVAKEWSKKYGRMVSFVSSVSVLMCTAVGDVIHLDVLGQHIIFLNTYERAIDLLEKRSALYSDRVHTPMTEL